MNAIIVNCYAIILLLFCFVKLLSPNKSICLVIQSILLESRDCELLQLKAYVLGTELDIIIFRPMEWQRITISI